MSYFPSTINLSGFNSATKNTGGFSSAMGGVFAAAANSAASGGSVSSTGAMVADGALEAAASMIPFGSIAKKILDKIGLKENIGLVSKYGLSSWGASTSPEQTKAMFAKKIYPYIKEKMAMITPQNVAQVVNVIEDQLLANHYYFSALRDHHSNAKSTKLANDWAQKEMKDLREKFVAAVRGEFKKYNVSFVRTKSSETGRQLGESGAIYSLKSGNNFHNDRDLDKYLNKQYYNWTVDYSKVKGLKKDENGDLVESKSGLSGLLTFGGLAFGAIKLLK